MVRPASVFAVIAVHTIQRSIGDMYLWNCAGVVTSWTDGTYGDVRRRTRVHGVHRLIQSAHHVTLSTATQPRSFLTSGWGRKWVGTDPLRPTSGSVLV